jgi:hypothetical protein
LFVNRCGGGAWARGVGPSTDGDGGRRVVDGSGNGLCRSSPTPALGTGPAGIGRAASRSATNCARSCSARSATHPHHRGQARARSRPVESPAWRSGHAAACAPGTRRSARSAPPHRTRRQATAPRPAGSRSSAGPRGPPGMPGARAARTPQIDDPRRPDKLERAQDPKLHRHRSPARRSGRRPDVIGGRWHRSVHVEVPGAAALRTRWCGGGDRGPQCPHDRPSRATRGRRVTSRASARTGPGSPATHSRWPRAAPHSGTRCRARSAMFARHVARTSR